MQPVKVTDKLSVAGQPALDDVAAIAKAGYGTLINNRPDGEEAGQPGAAAEADAAARAGLDYLDLPVTGATISKEDVRRFQEAVDHADGPVLAHCRTGTRSLTLWVLGEVMDGRMAPEAVRGFGAAHGIDLSGAVAWLERHAHG
ncbi:TIGR01244 family sulfur transferase [Geminicoccus roseus]|uniref:TIGR01244 family sulfur transferase n=1 Tax=Geminicoccus roseus TaxID=404900 RepID=UPI000409DDFA|nr:TIGR01244 family sulfur transferase [Geminicoccus roseus]